MDGPSLSERHWQNPFHKATPPMSPETMRASFQRSVIQSLHAIKSTLWAVRNAVSSSGTVYVGIAGIAYMYWHLSRLVERGVISIPRACILMPEQPPPVQTTVARKNASFDRERSRERSSSQLQPEPENVDRRRSYQAERPIGWPSNKTSSRASKPVAEGSRSSTSDSVSTRQACLSAQDTPSLEGAPSCTTPRHMHDAATTRELSQVALELCNAGLQATVSARSQRLTFLEGFTGPAALKCAILQDLGRSEDCISCAELMFQHVEQMLDAGALAPDECEVLYGRAGLLYSLLFVERTCPDVSVPTALVQRLINEVIKEGKQTATKLRASPDVSIPEGVSLMYCWHGTFYLGAAHGILGIMQVLTQASKHIDAMPNKASIHFQIKKTALGVVESQTLDSGNLTTHWGGLKDSLVQWCHGAPAAVMAMAALHAKYESNYPFDFQSAWHKASGAVWARGLLKKGLGLCHGIAGNGYAFLSAYRATGCAEYLIKALAFGEYAAQVRQELTYLPDRPLSLYEGLAGAVCFWADLCGPDDSHFPGFELPPAHTV